MREVTGMRASHLMAAGLCLALAAPVAPSADDKKDEKPTCSGHGTTIEFMDSPKDAATWAKKEGKLVFVLHVSGNFEDPRFT